MNYFKFSPNNHTSSRDFIRLVIKTFEKTWDQDQDLGHQVSKPRLRPWIPGLKKTKTSATWSQDQDEDFSHLISRPRPRSWSPDLETKTTTLVTRSRDRDQDLSLQVSIELQFKILGLEITSLRLTLFYSILPYFNWRTMKSHHLRHLIVNEWLQYLLDITDIEVGYGIFQYHPQPHKLWVKLPSTMSSAVHCVCPAVFSALTVYFPASSLKTSGMCREWTSPSWRTSKSGELTIAFPLRNHWTSGAGMPDTRMANRTESPSFTSVVLSRSTKSGGTIAPGNRTKCNPGSECVK